MSTDKTLEEDFVPLNSFEPLPPRYLIYPYIMEGVPNLLFGEYGSGKTYLSLGLAYSIYTGNDFCGHKVNSRKNVLFIDGESNGGERLCYRMTKVSKTFMTDECGIFYKHTRGLPLTQMTDFLNAQAEKFNAELIIIDSVTFTSDGKLEDSDAARRYINALNAVKTTTLCLGHTTKVVNKKSIIGSSVFMDGFRNGWYVSQTDGVLNMENPKVNDDAKKGVVNIKMEFVENGVSFSEIAESGLTATQKAIIEEHRKGNIEKFAIIDKLGISKKTLDNNLVELRKRGLI